MKNRRLNETIKVKTIHDFEFHCPMQYKFSIQINLNKKKSL